jgi:hypothetical protein
MPWWFWPVIVTTHVLAYVLGSTVHGYRHGYVTGRRIGLRVGIERGMLRWAPDRSEPGDPSSPPDVYRTPKDDPLEWKRRTKNGGSDDG